MQIKCEYCDQYYDAALPKCPNCGSPNDNLRRTANETPKTIEELKAYCARMGFTPEKTRFFIGQDYRGAKAFGIYKDAAGKCVVYKNKANGERAVRYEGYDEGYAVNELYERLQSEILNQKSHYVNKKKAQAMESVRRASQEEQRLRKRKSGQKTLMTIFIIAMIVSAGVPTIYRVGKKLGFYVGNKYDNGYYSTNEGTYYSLDDDWYYYDDGYQYWVPIETVPEIISSDPELYYESSYYDPNLGALNFEDTDYYSNWEYEQSQSSYDDSDSSWDNDSSWDDDDWGSDDWDYSDTDWDSDW